MKKIIITAISAIAVIASVIGCQIYDSQTNEVLASWMDKNGSEYQSREETIAKFNEVCNTFREATTDLSAYNKIVDTYLGYDKFFSAAMMQVKSDANVKMIEEQNDASSDAVAQGKSQEEISKILDEITEKYNSYLHDRTWCVDLYKTEYMTKARVVSDLIDNAKITGKGKNKKYFFENVKIKAGASETEAAWAITTMYEAVYKLNWDYNSKK